MAEPRIDLEVLRGHYFMPHESQGPEWFRVFELGNCETCGGFVQEANAVGVRAFSPELLLMAGLKKWGRSSAPPEIAVYSDDGATGCETCEGVAPTRNTAGTCGSVKG